MSHSIFNIIEVHMGQLQTSFITWLDLCARLITRVKAHSRSNVHLQWGHASTSTCQCCRVWVMSIVVCSTMWFENLCNLHFVPLSLAEYQTYSFPQSKLLQERCHEASAKWFSKFWTSAWSVRKNAMLPVATQITIVVGSWIWGWDLSILC